MSVSVHEEAEEVDLSKLISFGMAFEPLQLTIRDILRRLGRLERENTAQDGRIAELRDNVDHLQSANTALETRVSELEAAAAAAAAKEEEKGEEPAADPNAGGGSSDSDAIWDEIARLNALLGELQDGAERDRHTIDEIYAARKRQYSVSAGAATAEEGVDKASRASSAAAAPPHSTSGVPPRKPSMAPPPLQASEESAATKPVGDVILEKAREDLQFDGTHVYTAFAEEAPATAAPPHVPTQSRPHSVSISEPSRPMSGGVAVSGGDGGGGGEETGEHRGSVAFAISPHSRPASHAQRRSIYADQRITAAAARRASQFSTGGGGRASEVASASVFDKLKRDGDDIAYLNRVVAEILGEMKDLHADVDQLRTNQDVDAAPASRKPSDRAQHDGSGSSAEDVAELRRRLGKVEGDVVDAKQQLQRRDDGLQDELDELKKQLRVARTLTDDDVDALRSVRDLLDRLKQLEERVRVLEAAQAGMAEQFASVLAMGEKGDDGSATASEVNPLQFAALQGAVKNLEKQLAELLAAQGGQQDWSEPIRKLNEAVRALEGEVEAAQDQLQRTVKETSRLDEVKANKTDLPDAGLLLNNKRRSSADSSTVADLVGRMTRAEASIEKLNEDKADRTALQKLRDELNALRQLADQLSAQCRANEEARSAAGATDKLLREMQHDLNNLKDAARGSGGNGLGSGGGEDVEDLRDRIERLDHCKADATLVANKAERDYVENALERLMREVEQVLNATNAGLIDTLEKSLNILRDMIDGKATKQDVANLQGWMAETNGASGGGAGAGAADGLTGFKGFRCLGCNRPMDNMRPRTLPATMTPFLNRNPQNFPQDNVTRTIQQQQRMVGPANSFTAGARPAAVAGSPDASLHRSTSSEPLPPIE